MAELVLVYGRSGAGKTTSLRNFKSDEVAIIQVKEKRLPFKASLPVVACNDYMQIETLISKTTKKAIVIDDATYLMTDEFMRNIGKTGFQKFNDIAGNFNTFIETLKNLPSDVIVYLIGHESTEDGIVRFKTVGKAVDNYINLEGLCTIVLHAIGGNGTYQFQTQSNGQDTAKSPMGMFENFLIDNDLKAVDDTIREYYGIKAEKKEKQG